MVNPKEKKIKPCPFCGGKAQLSEFKEAIPYETGYYYAGEKIYCKCGANFKKYADDDFNIKSTTMSEDEENKYKNSLREKLINSWNKRL